MERKEIIRYHSSLIKVVAAVVKIDLVYLPPDSCCARGMFRNWVADKELKLSYHNLGMRV